MFGHVLPEDIPFLENSKTRSIPWISVYICFLLLNFLHVYFAFKEFSPNVTQLFLFVCLFSLSIYALDVIDLKSKWVKVRFHNMRGWSFSFCSLLAWGICSSALQIYFKYALIILTKEFYSISENLRSRHIAEESTVNRLFIFPRKNIRYWKFYCVGVIVYPVQYSSIALCTCDTMPLA